MHRSFDEWKKFYFPVSYEQEKMETMKTEEIAKYLADKSINKILGKA